jgi:hypothetical protein
MREASLEEEVAREIVSPMILKILQPFSAQDMNCAITNNVDLAKALNEDPDYLNYLRGLVSLFPFSNQAAPKIRSKRWVRWFLDNEMRHSRPDLYAQIIYHPNGFQYVLKEVRKLVKLLFE